MKTQYDLKTSLKDGDILHCYRWSILGTLIRFFTLSKYNHSALYHINSQGIAYVYDAQKDGFQKRLLTEWMSHYNYKFDVTRNSDIGINKETVRRAHYYRGTPYAKKDLVLKHLWQTITGIWKFRTKEIEQKEVVCSEIVGRCRGFNDAYRLSPKRLFKECISSGETYIDYNEL